MLFRSPVPPKPEPPLPAPKKPEQPEINEEVIGWLIVHTPNKEPVQHNLKEGENHIGDERGASTGKLDIPVGGDKFVSRGHAVLLVNKNKNDLQYIISDNKSNLNGRKSTNGTYINGNSKRITENQIAELKDGDAIQVGETTLRLKTIQYADDADDAKTQVLEMDHEKTVIIDTGKTEIL